MADVTLSAAVRQSLLSLQGTTDLVERTQNRLSTGLRVSSAIDDPVAFFQAKTLSDRAGDFNEKKDAIDQGVSSVTTAVDGLEAVESLVRQLKGIAQSLKSATGTQFTDLVTQFNDLRSQVDLLTADANYQGTNLLNGTGQTLSVEFSDKATSKLDISSVDVTASGLATRSLTSLSSTASISSSNAVFSYADQAAGSLSKNETISVTYNGVDSTITTATGAQTFTFGTVTVTLTASAGGTTILTQNSTYTMTIGSAGTAATGDGTTTDTTLSVGIVGGSAAVTTTAQDGKLYVIDGNTTTVDTVLTEMNTALSTLRSKASTLGSNVALLQTRLDFTNTYVSTLEAGSSKLTLADINSEGANLLALQTRQQLGIQALSFAGQAEQSILGLFR